MVLVLRFLETRPFRPAVSLELLLLLEDHRFRAPPLPLPLLPLAVLFFFLIIPSALLDSSVSVCNAIEVALSGFLAISDLACCTTCSLGLTNVTTAFFIARSLR